MINSELFDNQREQFFLQTQGSVYLPITGIVFWPSLGVAGYFISPQTWCLIVLSFFALMLPIGIILLTGLLKKPSLNSPLASLYFPALIPVLLSFSVTVPAYFSDLSLVPLTFVIGLAIHWPVFGWVYNQPVYIIHFIVRTAVALSTWVFFPQHLFTLLPISVGFIYLITAWWLLRN